MNYTYKQISADDDPGLSEFERYKELKQNGGGTVALVMATVELRLVLGESYIFDSLTGEFNSQSRCDCAECYYFGIPMSVYRYNVCSDDLTISFISGIKSEIDFDTITKGGLIGYATSTNPNEYAKNNYTGLNKSTDVWYEYMGHDSIIPQSISFSSPVLDNKLIFHYNQNESQISFIINPSKNSIYGGNVIYTSEYRFDSQQWNILYKGMETSLPVTIPANIGKFQIRVSTEDEFGYASSNFIYSNIIYTHQIFPSKNDKIFSALLLFFITHFQIIPVIITMVNA